VVAPPPRSAMMRGGRPQRNDDVARIIDNVFW
jgi:hypothetical protein